MTARRVALAILLGVGLSACRDKGRSAAIPAASVATATPPSATAPPKGTNAPAQPGASSPGLVRTYVPDSALIRSMDVGTKPTWMLERVFAGLQLLRPVFLTGAGDGSGRTFVVELRGVVTVLAPTSNPLVAPAKGTFLDITSRVHCGNEEGLFSIAFHPDFKKNGQVFACYSTGSRYVPGAPDQVRTRVSRFNLLANNSDALDPASEVVLLEMDKKLKNHNGGQIAFGPDRMLYVGIGDGGCCGDPERNGQNLGTLKGKILRIDVDGGAAGGIPYSVPSDNPFVSMPNARPEVWAYGFRNPWRFSFDRATGRMWIADVGQDAWEEISLGARGGNFGWPAYEGTHVADASLVGALASTPIAPVIEYDHPAGSCVIGGYVYRGTRLPSLQGAYLYADYSNGKVWAARHDGQKLTSNVEIVNGLAPSIASFGEDESGEVYLLSYANGGIYRLTPVAGGPSTFPQTLSATGLFADLKTQTMRPEMLPFGVKEPLYSDHALKSRSLMLPRLDPIQWTPRDGWGFPDGSVLVKHFSLERKRGDPTTKRIVETRLLIKAAGEWRGYSYEWNEQGTDATLLAGSKWAQFTVEVNGVARTQNWYFPSRTDCFKCHTAAAGFVLGPSTPQLDSEFDYSAHGGVNENQLAALQRIGVFAPGAVVAPGGPTVVSSKDTSAPLEERARSYLHANCAHCHRPGGGTSVEMDLRFDTPLDKMGIVDAPPVASDMGLPGAPIVKKGDPQGSILIRRLTTDWKAVRMPPVGVSEVDEDGVKLIEDWIRSLK